MARVRVLNRALAGVKIVLHRYGFSGTSNPSGWSGCDHAFRVDDELYGLEIRVAGRKPLFVRTGDPMYSPDLSALALFGAKFVDVNHGHNATDELKELFEGAETQRSLGQLIHTLANRYRKKQGGEADG